MITAFVHNAVEPTRPTYSIRKSTEQEQLDFRDWELRHTESPAATKISKARTAGGIAAAITLYYERPKHKIRDAADRANIAETILRRAKGK